MRGLAIGLYLGIALAVWQTLKRDECGGPVPPNTRLAVAALWPAAMVMALAYRADGLGDADCEATP